MGQYSQVTVTVRENVKISNLHPLTLLAGVNVLDEPAINEQVCEELIHTCQRLEMPLIFKASFDKANRSSVTSYRGPGLEKGLQQLADIGRKYQCPLITDVHEPYQGVSCGGSIGYFTSSRFFVPTTDLLAACARTGKPIHIKKMQMMAPSEMGNIIKKLEHFGCRNLLLCERGTAFGYHNLIVDPLSFPQLKEFGYPVTFDVTHALQLPGATGTSTGGRRQYALDLAYAGVSQGIAAIFLETHPDPSKALCDGPCATPLLIYLVF